MLDRFGPDAPRDAADDAVFRIHAVAEKEGEIGSEIIDRHPPAKIIFHIGEPVGQRKGQLRYRVSPGFGNMISAEGHTVKVANDAPDEIRLNVTHQTKGEFGTEDARSEEHTSELQSLA